MRPRSYHDPTTAALSSPSLSRSLYPGLSGCIKASPSVGCVVIDRAGMNPAVFECALRSLNHHQLRALVRELDLPTAGTKHALLERVMTTFAEPAMAIRVARLARAMYPDAFRKRSVVGAEHAMRDLSAAFSAAARSPAKTPAMTPIRSPAKTPIRSPIRPNDRRPFGSPVPSDPDAGPFGSPVKLGSPESPVIVYLTEGMQLRSPVSFFELRPCEA